MNIEAPFDLTEIEDVRMIIVAGGKHYAVLAATEKKEMARLDRVAACVFTLLQNNHIICSTSLEDVKEEYSKLNKLNEEE